MKKLVLSLLLLVSVFIIPSVQNVDASSVNITWTQEDERLIIGNVDLVAGTTSVSLYLEKLGYAYERLTPNNDDYIFNIVFRSSGVYTKSVLDTMTVHHYANDDKIFVPEPLETVDEGYSEIRIDFSAYEIPSTVDTMEIYLPVIEGLTIDEFYEIYDEIRYNSLYSYSTDPLEEGKLAFGLTLDIPVLNDYNTQDLYTTQYIEIEGYTSFIDIYLPVTLLGNGPEEPNAIYYYYENGTLARQHYISTIASNEADPQYYPNLSDDQQIYQIPWSVYGYDLTDVITSIRIEFSTYNSNSTIINAPVYADEFLYFIDHQSTVVNYIVEGEIAQTSYSIVGNTTRYDQGFPVQYPEVEGYTFSHWIDQNGLTVEYGDTLTSSMVDNGIINIYGIYTLDPVNVAGDIDAPEVGEGNVEVLLTDLGFNDGPERVIIFALALILVTGGLFALRVPIFNILIVDGIIVAFFISLGLLPTFVSIIIIIILIFLAYSHFMGGSDNND